MSKAMSNALSKDGVAGSEKSWSTQDESYRPDLVVKNNVSGAGEVIEISAGANDPGEKREKNSAAFKPANSVSKRIFDVTFASIALVWFAPLLLLIYVLVRLDGGPGLFRQWRVGRDEKLFPCYKFRTMVPDAESALKDLLICNEHFRAAWAADRKLHNDPRITKLGAFLRHKSLDELPQLWNIIRGDMSIVGPRPIITDELEMYGADLKYYTNAKPGLTGAWQVSGRNDTTYAERVALDVAYTSNWSFLTDLKIIFKTVGVVISGRGAR